MKNFTNNFKQFTSRLSARWLIMALMMLLGTSSAWAANLYIYSTSSSAKAWIWVEGGSNYTGGNWNSRPALSNTTYFESLGNNIYRYKKQTLPSSVSIILTPSGGSPEARIDNLSLSSNKYLSYSGGNTITQVTPSSYTRYVAGGTAGDSGGTDNVFGTRWEAAGATNKMTWDDSKCLFVKEYITNESSSITLTFKITNGTWNSSWPASNKTQSVSSGCRKTTITYNIFTNAVSSTSASSTECCTTVDAPDVTSNGPICAGSTATLTLNNRQEGVTYKLNSTTGTTIFTSGNNTYTTPALNANTTYKIYASHASACTNNVEGSVTVSLKAAPTKPAITLNPADGKIVAGESATLTVTEQNDVTFTLYKGGEATNQTGNSFTISEEGTYHVVGKNSCGVSSPDSDKKTITVCTPNATLLSATYNQQTDKIDLSGNLTETCGKTIYYGFLWKVKGDDWNTNNAISGTGNSYNSTSTNNTAFNQSWADAEDGTTYVFTAYALNTATNPHTWYYDETGIEVSKCITVATPNVTAAPVCAGNEAVLTLNSRQNGVTYKLGNTEIFKSGNTHIVTPEKTTTYTITATSAISCVANQKASTDVEVKVVERPEAPKFTSSSTTICEGETIELPTPTNIGSYEIAWSIKDAKNTPVPVTLTETTIFCAVLSNNGCLSTATEFTVNVTPIPTISGPTFAQPGKDNAIELSVPAGIEAAWSVTEGGDLDTNKGDKVLFFAEEKREYTITATNGNCTDTHVVTVDDAFYVYMRQPKKDETAYNNFYYPTQNPTQGGDLFYKEYASIPPAEGYTDYNQGGRAHDVILTDCDGYVWYGFKASAQLIDGTNYFTVHALNKNGYDGWFTHTDITKPGKMTGDIYYIMGTEGNGNSGWKIEEASAPYSGPVIYATDDSFNSNNFADFAALYVTDCSGKEITGYQWYKDGVEYVSKCEYTNKDGAVTGDAGRTNNIRPTEAGNYSCKVTYKDDSSKTSEAFPVEATSGTTYADFKSNLPVIMVNTGQKDFPDCPTANETASKNAEKMKKKLSVDVKILFNGSIVYDRKARMAYRGSSSLNFQKKSYAFCPGDANCGDADKGPDYVKTAKLNMLDIGKAADKDWVLYAAAADPSMLRNRMVFETYQAMRPGEWGVKSRYVELIINGEYKGVYLMMDKITQNKKRVNVEWDVKDETKRGFILKFDKTDIPDRSVDYPDGDEKTFLSKYSGKYDITTYDAQVDQAFEIEYPEKGDIEDDGGNWYEVIDFIKGMINEFETALSAGDYAKVQQYIDYESWADWFILSEYTKNVDAFRASCVFTYDGTKIKATPLWDQELSFNNQSVHANRYTNDGGNKGCQDANDLLIKHNGVYSDNFAAPFWFTGKLVDGKGTEKLAAKTFTGALLNDPCFVQMVKNRWETHKSGALSNASLTALITNYEKELTSAVRTREANFWSSNGYSRNKLSCSWGSNTTGYYDDNYATAKGHITAWISDNNATTSGTGRRKGLESAISALEGTGLDISISPASIETTPWVPVVIQVQNETGYEYTLTYTDGSLDQVKDLIIEKSGDTYKYHIPRPWPAGDEQVEDERANISYGLKATLQVGDGNVQCGSSAELPSATATIILKDEENDGCK